MAGAGNDGINIYIILVCPNYLDRLEKVLLLLVTTVHTTTLHVAFDENSQTFFFIARSHTHTFFFPELVAATQP